MSSFEEHALAMRAEQLELERYKWSLAITLLVNSTQVKMRC